MMGLGRWDVYDMWIGCGRAVEWRVRLAGRRIISGSDDLRNERSDQGENCGFVPRFISGADIAAARRGFVPRIISGADIAAVGLR
jgi:hypothetical protein